MKRSMIAVVSAMAMMLLAAGGAQATIVDFESEGGYAFISSATVTLARSTEQHHSGNYSAEYDSTSTVVDNSAKITIPYTGKLGQTDAEAWAYVPTNTYGGYPYLAFYIDANKNGTMDGFATGADALVLAFATVWGPFDTWYKNGLDASTKVHVVGDRMGLGSTEFTVGDIPAMEHLSDLRLKLTGGAGAESWGDLNVIQVRLYGAGTEFVDDIKIVPEPATMALLAVGGIATLLRRRRSSK